MQDEDRSAVRDLLESHNTLSLATCRDGKPWNASLFFASDKHLNIYFVSDYRTQHARHIQESDTAVAAINADCGLWTDVRGLQVEGRVTVTSGLERMNALRYYLAKFRDVKALFESPKDDNEQTIAERLKAANMYCLKPSWIRLIDNSRWFGYKAEFDLEG
ncbi:MAG: pyridoxamine 5'-phosphate oxidase family protein [Gammaproteobacteria bacterium]|nr:pyridoxamine 5'-phosphate oxidase family protein [Gammaproteobacteria bacterium]